MTKIENRQVPLTPSRRRQKWPSDPWLVGLALLTVGATTVGCGGKDAPQTQPTATQVTSQVEPPPPPPLPPPIREVKPTGGRSKVKVIEAGGAEEKPATLIEASRLAKARKQRETREPIAEINDENLAEFGEGADVIVLESEPAAPGPEDSFDAPDSAGTDSSQDPRDEEYWRNKALELRMGWRRSIDEVSELELESAALRQQFYSEDDPYIRDSQVKPSWDRVLDRLGTLRGQAQRYERELDSFLEEGRREGALQGWLNQGWELEPTAEERLLVDQPSFGTQNGEPASREPDANQ